MPDDAEAGPVAPAIDAAPAPVPAAEPTGAAHTVWDWYNSEIAGKVASVASLNDADAHLREKLPALIASLEQKA